LQTNYVLASRISVWLMDVAAEDALMMLSKPERLSCKLVGINVWRKLWFPAQDRPMIEGQLPVVFFLCSDMFIYLQRWLGVLALRVQPSRRIYIILI